AALRAIAYEAKSCFLPSIHFRSRTSYYGIQNLKNKKHLVMDDEYSSWLYVSSLNMTNTGLIIKIIEQWFMLIIKTIEQWFMEYGIPCTIRSDGGPQFRWEFKILCSKLGIYHALVSPYHSR
ncbi:hypothetical protein TCAL_08421, partial [Tigriopus californicus]